MKSNTKIVSIALILAFMLIALPMGVQAAPPSAPPPYWAQFIADVTVPDGTSFAPGAAFTKTWRLKNIGTNAWTSSDVSLIFDRGENMAVPGSPAILGTNTTVAPGQTMDFTVNMIAPNRDGHYFGYFKLNSISNGIFGIGSTAQKSFWVEIYVTSPSVAGYDFTENISSASFSSGAGDLPFPGDTGSANGFGIRQDAPVMENGVYSAQSGLLFSPQNVFNGYIQAVYPAFHVQNGDHFQATVGCEYGYSTCYVLYTLYYQIGTGPKKTFWSFREKYEGLTYNVNLDLSALANQDVNFSLAVSAYGFPAGDRALWVHPVISRAGGSLPPPPPSASLPDLLFSNVYLGMQGIPGNSNNCVPNYASYELRVTIRNQGLTPAFNIPVIESSTGTQLTIGELQPNQSMELYFPANSPTGTYNLVIDPQNTIQELDKNNNTLSRLAITPTPPAICTPVITPTATPAPQTNAMIIWQSAGDPCGTASFWSDHMLYASCVPGASTPVYIAYSQLPAYSNTYLSRYSIWMKAYAPFTAQTPGGTVTFNGSGYVIATPAEQRMMAEWANYASAEIPNGPRSGGGMAIQGHFKGDNTCFDINVYRDGRYRVVSCLSGYTYPAPDGYLDANELLYFYRWADHLDTYQTISTVGTLSFINIFQTTGLVAPTIADKLSIEAMVFNLESRAKGQSYTSGGGMPTAVFVAQKVLAQQLGIATGEIQVKNIENVNFPDVCLGAPALNEVCSQAVTSGYRVQLIAQSMLYEFHTDSAGYDIRQFGNPQSAP